MPDPLVIVSNRLPVTIKKSAAGLLEVTPSNGGLATAIASLPAATSRLWIGWPGIASDHLTAADQRSITEQLAKLDCVPIFLTQQQITQYYEGFANGALWPLFHYLPGYSQHHDAEWQAYRSVNELFAHHVSKHASDRSTIWIHDYHLMLLPSLLRRQHPGASIGFFLHTPFPSYEMFRQLPHRKDLLLGLLGADLVGFHIYDYAVHFAHSVQRLLGYESSESRINLRDRIVRYDAFPIGINYELFATAHQQPAVKAEMDRLRKHYGDTKIILSMDRLDYSKGILNRLEAYATFLERNPQHHNLVSLAMVAIPSRTDIPAYAQLRDQVDQAVSRINGRFGTVEWTPISYQYKNLPFEQIAALYAESAIALITPLRDGMNLVAKEFVATKQTQPGTLILSEMAGAADELPEALRINPNDRAAMVRAIERALSTPPTQQRKALRIMQNRISRYDVRRWAEDFLQELSDAHDHRSIAAVPLLDASRRAQLVADFRRAKRRLIILDYDGVLAELVSTPEPDAAKPTPERKQVLTQLAAQPDVTAAIISGRTRDALEDYFGDTTLNLSAEHGAWYKEQGSWQ
ncbi:MAG TPA: bifunctional alpha,alpha-trehalose-phosphate synthase (UDP-forming)/trehalose-phosphatase, partial [Candidatus Saccharimonadia bacterium]